MESAFLLLGTNIGDRSQNLNSAIQKLRQFGQISAISSIFETEPWGIADQPPFWNQAVRIETNLTASDLLHAIKKIEANVGRSEGIRWGPRIIDLDILLYGEQIIKTERLGIPHPRMRERKFVLVPLEEIASDIIDPETGLTIKKLLGACRDTLQVKLINF